MRCADLQLHKRRDIDFPLCVMGGELGRRHSMLHLGGDFASVGAARRRLRFLRLHQLSNNLVDRPTSADKRRRDFRKPFRGDWEVWLLGFADACRTEGAALRTLDPVRRWFKPGCCGTIART